MKTILYLALLTLSVMSWDDVGHFIVATIARKFFVQNNPELLYELEIILGSVSEMVGETNYNTFDKTKGNFVECAAYPIREAQKGALFYENVHTRKQIYNYYFSSPNIDMDDENVVWMIEKAFKVLSNDGKIRIRADGSEKDTSCRISHDFGAAIALRELIHFIGDIYQPLNNINVYSEDLKTGDDNCKKRFIKVGKESVSLHKYWESNLNTWNKVVLSSPLSNDDYNYLNAQADIIIKKYDYNNFEPCSIKNVRKISQDNYNIARNDVFNLLKYDKGVVNKRYIDYATNLIEEQLATAAYCLVYAIYTAMGDNVRKSVRDVKTSTYFIASK